ncbi:MAG: hypothetical protein AB8B96_16340 [Lysobacterales bacterium]
MELASAQENVRRSYVGGGPGVIVSGVIWVIAGLVERQRTTETAFVVLFFGGMLIFPLATLIARQVFKRPALDGDNRLSNIALESTIAMIGGFLAAYLILPTHPQWVFPLLAIAVGTHYFAFNTLYGDRTFWVLGTLLAGIGIAAIVTPTVMSLGVALPVGVIEIALGAYIAMSHARRLA